MRIKTKNASNEHFDSIERPVRKAIMMAWFTTPKRKLGKMGELVGVKGNWEFQYKGKPNTDPSMPKDGNRVDKLKGVTLENIQIFSISYRLLL